MTIRPAKFGQLLRLSQSGKTHLKRAKAIAKVKLFLLFINNLHKLVVQSKDNLTLALNKDQSGKFLITYI